MKPTSLWNPETAGKARMAQLDRNALVAAFLKALEYYPGILFERYG